MANIRGLRSRIKGITSTQQITKAMKMVAGDVCCRRRQPGPVRRV